VEVEIYSSSNRANTATDLCHILSSATEKYNKIYKKFWEELNAFFLSLQFLRLIETSGELL
jgi:hypothetical protein